LKNFDPDLTSPLVKAKLISLLLLKKPPTYISILLTRISYDLCGKAVVQQQQQEELSSSNHNQL
jgi:hypothetical protein